MNELIGLAYLEIIAAWIAFLFNTLIQNTLQSKNIKVDTASKLSVCFIVIETYSCNISSIHFLSPKKG